MYNSNFINLIGGMNNYDSQALPSDSESEGEPELEYEFSIEDYHRSLELIERYNIVFSQTVVSLNDLIRFTLQTGITHSIPTGEEDVNIQTLFPIFELFNFNTGNDYLYYLELGYSPENIERIFKSDPRWYVLSRIQQYAHTENEHVSCNFIDLINILQESPVSDNKILFFEARFELIEFILSKYNPEQKQLFLSLKYNLESDLIQQFPYSICRAPYFFELEEPDEYPEVPLLVDIYSPFILKQDIEDNDDVENLLEHKITLRDFIVEYSQS